MTTEARDHRRWQIGIAISLVFGLFGMVMAYLNYAAHGAAAGGDKATPQVAESAVSPTQTATPPTPAPVMTTPPTTASTGAASTAAPQASSASTAAPEASPGKKHPGKGHSK